MAHPSPTWVANLDDVRLALCIIRAFPGTSNGGYLITVQKTENGPWTVLTDDDWPWWLDPFPSNWRYRIYRFLDYPNPGGFWGEFAFCGTYEVSGEFSYLTGFLYSEYALGTGPGDPTQRYQLELWLCQAEYVEDNQP